MAASRADADADDSAPKGGKAYACKPATRQWLALPDPKLCFFTAATAMVARPAGGTADFKILRLPVPTLRDRLRCEIFDSRWGAWWRPDSLVAAGLFSLLSFFLYGAVYFTLWWQLL